MGAPSSIADWRLRLAESGRAGPGGSSREFDRTGLSQHGDLDLAGVGQLPLDRTGDVPADLGGCRVVELLAVDDHADLAAGLDRVGLLDAGEAKGERLELLEPSNVFLQGLAPRPRTAGADGIGRGDEHGVGGLDAEVVVVAKGGVDDLLRLAVAAG